ncbi:hypothetical protein B0H10DRAFT_1955871 [Mycena sp. CBHHK59/15]|nr:hypothetical protein B0H10DRAFT_1955871 [Mycena sp. CBHHK59/15]
MTEKRHIDNTWAFPTKLVKVTFRLDERDCVTLVLLSSAIGGNQQYKRGALRQSLTNPLGAPSKAGSIAKCSECIVRSEHETRRGTAQIEPSFVGRCTRSTGLGEPSYTLQTVQEVAEKKRLDEVNLAFREYQGEKIYISPIYENPPRRILDLGAIDAVTDFPEAQIVAVDLYPFPGGPDFQRRTRSLGCVTPGLVKPGGWLLLEDLDIGATVGTGGPAVSRFAKLWGIVLRSQGANAEIGNNNGFIRAGKIEEGSIRPVQND